MAKIVVLFGAKGGAGKTLIAANLATALAAHHQQRVCLIDFDLQAPRDLSRMLNINVQKSLADLQTLATANVDTLRNEVILTKTKLGLDFISATMVPQQSCQIDQLAVTNLFTSLDEKYDYIVIDAGQSFSDTLISILDQAHLILLVITPDVLSVYQTRWVLDTLQSLNFPLKMMRIILNRAESVSSISWQEIKATLPIDILVQIPSEGRIVGQAVNRGIPVLADAPRSKITQTISKLAALLIDDKTIFADHQQIERGSSAGAGKAGDFWRKQGLGRMAKGAAVEEVDALTSLKRKVHNRLIDELNIKRLDSNAFSDVEKARELRERAQIVVTNILAEEAGGLFSSADERKTIIKEILDEALGLGPLEDLLADQGISDIMVNNKDEVYIERDGKIILTNKKFVSNEQVKRIIERIIAPIGRRIDESMPMVDARLNDGSRVNAIIPPLSLTGPAVTIRKFRKESFKAEELVELKSLSQAMVDFLRACVVSRKNIIVSGGTGSGKTTVLNVLSNFIPEDDRIITIEDAAELKLNQVHWIRLESRPPNIEGKGSITIKDLFRNTLRMRPDRIIIGECRGVESLDMLQAMNTGHDGSMTTIHANSTHDVLARLDSMILMSGIELPLRSIREMIAAAVDIIVHTARLSDGSRRVMQITEIAGMLDETHIGLHDVFAFKQTGLDENKKVLGNYLPTGYIPTFAEDIRLRGIPLPDELFKKK